MKLTGLASMGPRSRERGNLQVIPDRVWHLPASMGPRSRERGNLRISMLYALNPNGFNGAALT